MAKKKPQAAYLAAPEDEPNFDALDQFLGGLEASKPAQELPNRGVLRGMADVALAGGRGAVQGVRMFTDLAGSDNAASRGLRTVEDFIGGLRSAQAKQDDQEAAAILKAAENAGILDQVVAGAKAFAVAPVSTLAQAVGTSIPTIGAALIPGVGQGAAVARMGAALGMGAAQGAGSVKGQIYDEVKQELLQAGASPEEAERRALEASSYDQSGGKIATGAALGALAGSTGMERAIGAIAHGTAKQAARRVLTHGATEALPEAAQGAQEKLASNQALYEQGFDVAPGAGVVAAGTMEGLAGFGMGAAAGLPRPAVRAGDQLRAEGLQPERGPYTRASNAAVEAAANKIDFDPSLAAAGQKLQGMAGLEQAGTAPGAAAPKQTFGNEIAYTPDPDTGRLAIGDATEIAKANIARTAAKHEPMPQDVADGIVAKATERGLNMVAVPHPEGGGFTVVPREWVTAAMAAPQVAPAGPSVAERAMQAAESLTLEGDPAVAAAQQEARRAQIQSAPVDRALRVRTPEPAAPAPAVPADVVQAYVESRRNDGTPAGRFFATEFDAGRITRDEVQGLIDAARPKSPDQRLAEAAAQAPKPQAPQPGDILNPKGEPFRNQRAATNVAQREGGSVIVVDGGWAVRKKESDAPATGGTAEAQPADAGRGDRAGVLRDQRPADVPVSTERPADQGAEQPGAAVLRPDGPGEPATPALTLREQWQAAVARGDMEAARAINEQIVAAKKGNAPVQSVASETQPVQAPATAAPAAPAAATGAAAAPMEADGVTQGGPGSDAGNGFKNGPKKGERYRVGAVAAAGGALALEKRLPAGTAATFYVGKDGNFIDSDDVNFIGSGRERLWIPESKEAADRAAAILDEIGRLELTDPKRKEAKERLKALVRSEVAGSSEATGVNGRVASDATPKPSSADQAPVKQSPSAPDLVKVTTVYGKTTYVRQTDLQGDENRLVRQYTKDGKNNGRIARGNLDPTGEKRAADAKEVAANPLFNLITRKGGATFANRTAAKRELIARSLQDTHEVVPASEVQPGLNGFLVRKKATPAPAAPESAASTTQGEGHGQTQEEAQGLLNSKPAQDQGATVAPTPASAQAAIDAWNADDHERAMAVVAKIRTKDELRKVGEGVGYSMHYGEGADAYRKRLAEVAPRLNKTAREKAVRQRALFDKLMDRAMDYDRAADHAARAKANGVADDSTSYIGFYKPLGGGESQEMRIPAMLDRLAADVASLKSDPDYAEVAPMVRDKRPRVFDHTPTAAAPATHADPGAAPEPATQPVIAASLAKAARRTDMPIKDVKAEALRLIDEAMAGAKTDEDMDVRMYADTAPGTKMSPAQIAEYKSLSGTARDKYMKRLEAEMAAQHQRAADNIGYVTIDVPGDGKFKVLNTKDRLAEFRRKVETSPGFKAKRPGPITSPRVNGYGMRKEAGSVFGVEGGSGTAKAAIEGMIDEGDAQAAVDYAAMKGLDLAEVLKGQKDRLAKVAGLTPTADGAAPQPEKQEAAPAENRLDNFGEALPPARRNMAAKLTEDLADDDIAKRPLSEIWPLAENEAIEDSFAAAVAHAARAEIPSKPRQPYKLRLWVEKVKTLRGLAGRIVSGEVTRDRMGNLIDTQFRSLRDWWSKVQLLEDVSRDQWKRIGSVEERPDAITYEDGKQVQAPTLRIEVDGKGKWLHGDVGVDGAARGTVGGNKAGIMAMFSRGGASPGRRVDLASAQALADQLASTGLIRLNVVQSVSDMPLNLQRQLSKSAPDGRVRGAYFRGTDEVWMVADHIRGANEFVEVALHEAFHRGLGKTIPDAKPLLREIWRTNQNVRKATADQMRQHGIGRDEAIEEALAKMAEAGEVRDLKGWPKLLEAIRTWLGKMARAVGIEMVWTDDMVADLVAAATREGLKAGVHANTKEGIAADRQSAFERWFGDSKVVDASGKPLVVYHGTAADFAVFDKKRVGATFGADTQGFFFSSDTKTASGYADFAASGGRPEANGISGANVIPAYVSLKNPLTLEGYVAQYGGGIRPRHGKGPDALTRFFDDDRYLILQAAKRGGHDGILFSRDGHQLVVAFRPEQIKSAIGNRGDFDPTNPDIRAKRAPTVTVETDEATGAPVYATDDISIGFPQETERFEYVLQDGEKIVNYSIGPADGFDSYGFVELVIGADGIPKALADIEIRPDLRGQAIGEKVMAAILGAHPGTDIEISNIVEGARGFWAKMGVPEQNRAAGEAYDGTLNYQTFQEAQDERAANRAAAGRGAAGEGRNASAEDRAQGADGQAQGLMLSRAEPADATDMRSGPVVRQIQQRAHDLLATKRTFNWWHRTVGTQYHKAQVDADFGKVYTAAQDFIHDTSAFANDPADLAPDLLPQLKSLGDLKKTLGLNKRDRESMADAVFQGTLDWTRDDSGQPVKAGPDDTAGIVWTPAELRERFGFNDRQVKLYEQFRASVDRSLDTLVASDVVRLLGSDLPPGMRALVSSGDLGRFKGLVTAFLQDAPGMGDVADQVAEKYDRIEELKARGYAPLMRFGRYTVDVVSEDGERKFFGLYESEAEANRAARQFKEGADPGDEVTQGVLSEEAYKQFQGMTPETLELFAEVAGVEKNDVFQEYLKRAKNNRSALKRLIHRKGIAGYSEDASRVLAQFLTSNARAASSNLHLGEMAKAVQDIPKQKGDVIDEAIRLREYVQTPQEEAQALRGLMFASFLGGSVASAMVNLTQPLMMTLPYLSQFGGPAKAAARLMGAMGAALGNYDRDSALGKALAMAEKEGIVSPQEMHQLQAEASGSLAGHPALRRLTFAWGSLFSAAEQFNRRLSFVAAYNTAVAEGKADPAAFAAKAVEETQGVYNKGNKPRFARGTVGAVAFTFKQYSVSYMEFLKRLPTRERTMALAVLLLAAGAQGMPGADDLDDLIDTLGQGLGYDTNAKLWKTRVLSEAIGSDGADFVLRGFSALPGFPLDVAGRLGLGNMIPGTGLLLKSKQDKAGEVAEALGPAASLAKGVAGAVPALASGNLGGVVEGIAPKAVKDLRKALEMYQTGEYRDTKGRKVTDADATDALVKGLGFQPAQVARDSRRVQMANQQIALAKATEAEFADAIARARVDGDPDAELKARQRLADWNASNPESRIVITPAQLARRARELRTTRDDRFVRTAPKEMRQSIKELVQ